MSALWEGEALPKQAGPGPGGPAPPRLHRVPGPRSLAAVPAQSQNPRVPGQSGGAGRKAASSESSVSGLLGSCEQALREAWRLFLHWPSRRVLRACWVPAQAPVLQAAEPSQARSMAAQVSLSCLVPPAHPPGSSGSERPRGLVPPASVPLECPARRAQWALR